MWDYVSQAQKNILRQQSDAEVTQFGFFAQAKTICLSRQTSVNLCHEV